MKEGRTRKNSLRICLETPTMKSLINLWKINRKLDIKLGQFMAEELDVVLKKKKKKEKSWSMENKEIWWHISLIMQRCL